MKVLLPLAALVLLSTLFLIARSPSRVVEIPFAEIEEIAREQRVGAPRFSGTAKNGAAIAISADTIRPMVDVPDRFAIEEPRAEIDLPKGVRIEIRAGTGEIDSAARTARLDGLARLSTSDGYEMETAGLLADLDAGRVTSLGPLEVHAPFGELVAQQMEVTTDPNGANPRTLFSGGVRLLYRPEPRGERE